MPSVITEKNASAMPKAERLRRRDAAARDRPVAVRAIRASISASYHMLSAPEAPAPTAMQRSEVKASTGCTWPGASTRPTSAVNTTSDITRGFSSAR